MPSEKKARRALLWLGLVLLILFLLSFSLGRYGVPPRQVVKILGTRFCELFAGRGALPRSWTKEMESPWTTISKSLATSSSPSTTACRKTLASRFVL